MLGHIIIVALVWFFVGEGDDRTPSNIGGLSSQDIRPACAVEKYPKVEGSLSLLLIVVSHLENQNLLQPTLKGFEGFFTDQ